MVLAHVGAKASSPHADRHARIFASMSLSGAFDVALTVNGARS
jgi:hypothetical protein